jgi:magnesium chelatase family protein
VKAVPGAIASAVYARELGRKELITSAEDAAAAAEIDGVRIIPVRNLFEAVCYLRGSLEIEAAEPGAETGTERVGSSKELNFSDVVGQHAIKRALEVAAAGAHNLLMVGPPGAGKSMLARRMLSILPHLAKEEALEVTRIYAALEMLQHSGGKTGRRPDKLSYQRPFRSPHHTTSSAGLIGGGSVPMPGEISLAHRGVLFLDEFVEFRRDVLESLREPLEVGTVMISRAKMRVSFPADFMLLAAMNPCPCGRRGSVQQVSGDAKANTRCECSPGAIQRYAGRLSGPILDRIDIQVWVPAVPVTELQAGVAKDPTPEMYSRVLGARERQKERFGEIDTLNKDMGAKEIKRYCKLDSSGNRLLERAVEKYELSARGYTRILRTSRTIADLDGQASVSAGHLAEALSYRMRL